MKSSYGVLVCNHHKGAVIRKILNHWGKINRIFIPRMRQEKMRFKKKERERGKRSKGTRNKVWKGGTRKKCETSNSQQIIFIWNMTV